MIQAGTGFSKNRNAEKAAESASRAALEKSGASKADTVLFFASSFYKKHYEAVAKKIRDVTGAKTVVGASSHGVLTEEQEIERHPAVAVMALAADEIHTRSFLIENLQENNFLAGEKAGTILQAGGLSPQMTLLFPDPFSFQSPFFFDGFESAAGYAPLLGGCAGEEGSDGKTYQIENGRAAFDAVAGLAFSGRFRTETGLTRSCQPFGEPLKITRAEGNMIYEMDGRPAYDILLESISHFPFQNSDQVLERVFLGTPLRSFQTEFSNHYLIRNIMGVNVKKGMLACVAPVEEGEFVTFAMRDPVLARQDMRTMLEDLKGRVEPSKPAFGFYFNCGARGEALYNAPNADIAIIRESFPGIPILGFFAYGEIAPVDHVNHLHYHSGVLTLVMP